jgi:hypothetical protein
MARTRKHTHDLLLPGPDGWTRWTGSEGSACELAIEYGQSSAAFHKDQHRRVLALPASHIWVLPAWLNGEVTHLRDMATLHLERQGVRVTDPQHGLQIQALQEKDGAHLTRVLALKDLPNSGLDLTCLPDEVVPSATCRMLPEDSIIIQREMSRIVVTITYGREIIYCSPLSAHRLNELALNELNHLCLQLGFQRVLGSVRSIVLWLEEGDITEIERVTGLPARREVQPAPFIPTRGQSSLVPSEILSARLRHQSKARTRALVLSAGLAMAACVAVMAVMISYATRQRDMLLEEVADLSPRASQVLDHKKSWLEAAPAVDPTFFPMQVLLDSMTPSSSREVSLTNFEWNPDRLVLRGRMPSAALALQYANEITEVENLTRFVWETPAPTIASDNSATFELTGEIKP